MSRKKHNIAYIKPDEPKFLRDLKLQAGYKESPTVDTKREELPEVDDGDRSDADEEEPVVVVVREGDLTAEEAEAIRKKKADEEENAKADLTKRVIFKKKSTETISDESVSKKTKKPRRKKVPLSFDDEDQS